MDWKLNSRFTTHDSHGLWISSIDFVCFYVETRSKPNWLSWRMHAVCRLLASYRQVEVEHEICLNSKAALSCLTLATVSRFLRSELEKFSLPLKYFLKTQKIDIKLTTETRIRRKGKLLDVYNSVFWLKITVLSPNSYHNSTWYPEKWFERPIRRRKSKKQQWFVFSGVALVGVISISLRTSI